MLVLLPDAQFEDDAEIEREVLGDAAQFAIHHEVVALRVPDEHWRRADAVIVYYGVPVDRELIERLDSCRILVRAGVGYDHIDVDACAPAASRCATCRTTGRPRSPITRSR
jgi:phosphoglycerate dehydrogenase-like enzyme